MIPPSAASVREIARLDWVQLSIATVQEIQMARTFSADTCTLLIIHTDMICIRCPVSLFCSMTFCFSFDVLMKLNPIQVNITGGRPSQ